MQTECCQALLTDCKVCEQYILKEQINAPSTRNESTIKKVQITKVTATWELYDYDIGCYRNVGFRCSNYHEEYGNEPFYPDKGGSRFAYCPSCEAKIIEG